jgi:hypothetical protein
MKSYFGLMLAFGATLLLGACDKQQDAVAGAFNATCAGAPLVDAAFKAAGVFAPDVIDDNAVRWEGIVYAGIVSRCSGPEPDISSYPAVIKEIQADIAAIMEVVKAARANAKPA